MFRARANPVGLLASKSRPLKRAYHGSFQPSSFRVRLLGPTLWSVAACSTIYLGCAAYEVYQDARRTRRKGTYSIHEKTAPTFEDLQDLRDRVSLNRFPRSTAELSEFNDAGDLVNGTMAVTAAIYLASSLVPGMSHHFIHVPLLPHNYTLLTSVFGHAGLLHLGCNLYGMFMLMPRAASSPTLEQSSTHLAAFFASAGILSSLAQHATAALPRGVPNTGGLGASGALFALLGVVGISFPDTQIGILFLPGSIPISDALIYLALFDAIGIFVRYPFFSFGHAAHLGGLSLGVAYAKLNGGENIWRPGRRVAFKAMRSLGVI
ncbi:hypothetical protein F4803DRAFT_556036 [Xylaria telfairii]|nr:hypothetical protein F4803DRAFT_556036 [Xylaria telfairii]